MLYVRILFAFLWFWSLETKAAEIKITENLPAGKLPLSGALLMLEDASSDLSLADVKEFPDSQFQAAGGRVPNYGFTKSAYWARLKISNTGSQSLPMVLEYAYPQADFVDIYVSSSQSSEGQSFLLGDRRTPPPTAFRYRLPAIPIDLVPGETILHMRVQTAGAQQWPVFLYRATEFQDKKTLETGVLAIAFGAVYALLFYNLFLFLVTRKALVAWYVLFLLSIGLAYPIQQGLFPFVFYDSDMTWWNNAGSLLFGGMATTFGMLFAHRFLNLDPKRDKKTHWFFVFVASTGVLTSLFAPLNYNLAAKLGGLALLLTVAAIFGCSFYRFLRGRTEAGFLALAWSAFIACGIVYMLSLSGAMRPNLFTQFSLVFGAVFENVFLSLAVGYKLRRELSDALQDNQRMNEVLVEKEQARTLFFHNTSHELRTPLNGIIGFLDLVRRDHFGFVAETAKHKIEKSLRLADALKHQVDTILDLAKSRRGELKLTRQLISLPEILEHADNLAEGLAFKMQGTEYSSSLMDKSQDPFYGDLEKVDTILRNLLGNAFKFADPHRSNRVELKLWRDENELKIEVRDRGIGIPEAYREKIFEEFSQVQADSRRAYEGTGLGLSMVRDLVGLMQGRIELDSKVGEGSRFTLTIPSLAVGELVSVSPSEAKTAENQAQVLAYKKSAEVLVEIPSSKDAVLLIDDNEINCEVISEILRSKSIKVNTALSGRQGLALMRSQRPQLVLLDMMMPEMSGEDVLHAMRSDEGLRDIPVILVTARASEQDKLHGLALGADDYLAKPIVAEELCFRVSNLLERHNLLRQVERIESQDKLVQMGELFGDLSHELKNILHSGANVSELQIQEAQLALAGIPLGESERDGLAEALLRGEGSADGLRRMEGLEVPTHSPSKQSLRSLRQILAFMNVSDQVLSTVWQELLNMGEDELRYLENQLKILDQHQALVRVSKRTKELAHSVLAYSRSGSAEDTVDLSRVWLQVLQMVQARAKRYAVSVARDIDAPRIRANPSQLLQILLNLSMNALDAIGNREPDDRWIKLNIETKDGSLLIHISNGGPQIPSSVRERLFERGFSTKGEQGTGIGLHVSKRLAQKMGGDLYCEGSGSHPCFVLVLPLASEGNGVEQAA